MKRETKVILLSICFGLFVWTAEALVDWTSSQESTLLQTLLYPIPLEKLFYRLTTLVIFIVFGFVMSRVLARRRRIENALRESEARYRAVVEQQTDLIFRNLPDGTITFVNEVYCRCFDKRPEELIGRRFIIRIPEEDHDSVERFFSSFNRGHPVATHEHRVIMPDGEIRWQQWTNRAIFDEGGAIVEFQAVGRDVTERKVAELALRRSETRFRTIFDNVKDGIFIETLEGRILDANNAACQMLGYSRKELCSMNVGDVVPPSIAGKLPPSIQEETAKKGRYIETLNVRKDGTRVPVEVSSTIMKIGGEKRVIAIIRDITQRWKAEEALRESEEKYRTLVESASNAIFVADAETGVILKVNRMAEKLLGRPAEEIVGMQQSEIHPAEERERYREIFQDHVQRGRAFSKDLLVRRGDGSDIPVEISASVVEVGGEKIILGIFRDVTERKRAEEELRAREEKYRALIETTDTGYLIVDGAGKVIDANQEYVRLTGHSSLDEIVGRTVLEWTAAHDRERNAEEVKKCGEKGFVRNLELDYVDKDGKITPIEVNARVVETGEGTRILSLCRDITERKSVQEALERHAKRVIAQRRAILELSQKPFTGLEDALRQIAEVDARTLDVERVGVWFFNEGRSRIDCLEEYVKSKGAHRVGDSLVVERYPAYFKALEKSRFLAADDALIDPRTCEFAHSYLSPFGITSMMDATIRLHGRTIGVICHEHVGPSREWSDDEQDFAASMADMVSLAFEASEKGKVEKDVQQLALAVEQAAETIIISDAKARIQYVNPAFEETTGYRKDEVIGRTLGILKSGKHDDDFFRKMWNTLRKGEVWRGRIVNRRKNGELYEDDVTMSPIRNRSGTITSYVEVRHDITQQVVLEEQLRHAQKMEAVGTLAGGLAHDFNNILAGIMGYASLTKQVLEDGSPQHSDMEQIEQLSRRGAALTQALLAFSRKGKYKPNPVKVDLILEEVLGVLGRTAAKGIAIEVEVAPDLSNVLGDEGQLSQVFMNLCLNACEAMHEGGTLRVEARDARSTRTFYSLHPNLKEERYVAVVISDTGCGIDPGTLGRIFEPFFTTKAEKSGTGLGLSIVNGIVEKHGGCIEVESEEGRGSSFTVYLPATDEEIPETGSRLAGTLRGDETILVVDDEEGFRLSAVRWLMELGYEAIEAASGEEALEILGTRKGGIDLVLLDMVMGGMNGTETFVEMRKLVPDISVIICTGYSLDVTARRILEGGADGFLQKPFDLTKLALRVRAVLDSR